MADYTAEFNTFSRDAGYQDILNRMMKTNDAVLRGSLEKEANAYTEAKRNEWNRSNPTRPITSSTSTFSFGEPTRSPSPTPSAPVRTGTQSSPGVKITSQGGIRIGATGQSGAVQFDKAKAEAAVTAAKAAAEKRVAERKAEIATRTERGVMEKFPTVTNDDVAANQGPSTPVKYDEQMKQLVPNPGAGRPTNVRLKQEPTFGSVRGA